MIPELATRQARGIIMRDVFVITFGSPQFGKTVSFIFEYYNIDIIDLLCQLSIFMFIEVR